MMSGRRSHTRYAVHPAPEGALRVLRDVMVRRTGDDELVVSSREPGVVNERLGLEMAERQGTQAMDVVVAESRPVILEGAVRHRLVVRVVGAAAPLAAGGEAPPPTGAEPGTPAAGDRGGRHVDE